MSGGFGYLRESKCKVKNKINNNFVKIIKEFLPLLKILGCAVVIGYVLMLIVYAIPVNLLKGNIAKSIATFEKEGLYPTIYCSTNVFKGDNVVEYNGVFGGMVDNYTDGISILEAGNEDNISIFKKALLCPRYDDYNGKRIDTLIKAYRNNEKCSWGSQTYARYWHGYLVAYKPLLIVTSYEGIRKLFHVFEYVLVILIVLLLIKKKRRELILPVLAAFWFICPEVIYRSMAAYPMFAVTFIELAFILIAEKLYDDRRIWLAHFLITGCVTSYVDFLTFPLVTLGVPLLFLLVYKNCEIVERIVYTIKCGISWALGYVGMWASKWILASIITDENVIMDAVNTIFHRMSGVEKQTGDIGKLELIRGSLSRNSTYVEWFMIFMVIVICFAIVTLKNKTNRLNTLWSMTFFALPFIWYIVCANHSYIHYWFTYRTLTIAIFAGCIFIVDALKELGFEL